MDISYDYFYYTYLCIILSAYVCFIILSEKDISYTLFLATCIILIWGFFYGFNSNMKDLVLIITVAALANVFSDAKKPPETLETSETKKKITSK
jgi:hypothetical protein